MNPAHPDLAQHLRRLVAAVTCAVEGRWRWLPMALLTWVRERRMRREQEAALALFQSLMGQLLAMLEDFRAGNAVRPFCCSFSMG